jgi:hypothetical protein
MLTGLAPLTAAAQEPPKPAAAEQDATELAKKLNNPISDLVSVPFQFNWAQPVGPGEGTRLILNVQPVMPFSLTKDVNLVARVIMPIIGQPPLFEGGTAASGLGDVFASFFFQPAHPKRVIWGVGPAIVLPSTSDPALGAGKWSLGPTIVVVKQTGPWTVGVLWNQVWSFAGSKTRADVSQMLLQPFVTYTSSNHLIFAVNTESTANWKAATDKWTVPVNFMVSRISSFGPFPASYQVGVGPYLVSPEGGPDWQLRAALTLLLPRKK